MIRWKPAIACALAVLTFCEAAQADVGPDTVQVLMHQSGLWDQLGDLPVQTRVAMKAAAAAKPGRIAPEQQQQLVECVDQAFSVDRARATATAALATALTPADVQPLKAWFDSPLGGRIAEMEKASSALEVDPQERLRTGMKMLSTISPKRKGLLQTIVTATQAAEFSAEMYIGTAVSVQQGLALADPSAPSVSRDGLQASLERLRPQLQARYAGVMLAIFALDYGGLNDDELQQYVDFMQTPAATSFNKTSMASVSRTFEAGGLQMGQCMHAVRTTKGS